ncbi:hypothetical protein mRhiFer1_008073 [Rhinolophus ferrumequinum]|uniref:Uncharacterized protein n=1 Tax=Rhinolophus ferrumequinum TaxID=59479 RepID=A0A7J7WR01_RHIFE|nr:hypothetical protein mRhiFer1_008073 [Rhinolophus ferrumequinum]
MTGAGKVHRRDAMTSHQRNSLEDCFLNECASQSPGGLVKTAGPPLWRLWFSRLEWGPIICVSNKFPGPDAASPDHTLHDDNPESIHPQVLSLPNCPNNDLLALPPSTALCLQGKYKLQTCLLSAPLASTCVTPRTDLHPLRE